MIEGENEQNDNGYRIAELCKCRFERSLKHKQIHVYTWGQYTKKL